MTKKEALTGTLQVSVSDDAIVKAFTDADINGADTYTRNDTKAIDMVAIELLQGLLAAPDVSEGGYSVKYDRKALQTRLAYLSQKYGVAAGPIIRSPKVW